MVKGGELKSHSLCEIGGSNPSPDKHILFDRAGAKWSLIGRAPNRKHIEHIEHLEHIECFQKFNQEHKFVME